jgi:uncharacterized membrane protein YccC
MSGIATQWKSLFALAQEHKGQLGLSLRVTVAAVLGLTLSLLLSVPLPLWTVLTAVILTQVTFGRSVKATIDYVIGTLCGAIYAGVLATLVPHANEFALAAVLAITVAPLALLGAINPSFTAATFTGVLVVLVPGITHVGPIQSAFNRLFEVAVGGVTALAVSLLVFPARARSLATETASQMLDLMARHLPELFLGFTQPRDAAAIGRLQDSIGRVFVRLEATAIEVRHEQISFLAAQADMGPLLRTLLRLRHDLIMIGRAAAAPLPETLQTHLGPSLAQVTKTAAEYLQQTAQALATGGNPTSVDAVEAAIEGYTEAFTEVRSEGLTLGLSMDTVERIFALGFALEEMRTHLRDLDRCVREIGRQKY